MYVTYSMSRNSPPCLWSELNNRVAQSVLPESVELVKSRLRRVGLEIFWLTNSGKSTWQ